jgi:hypothetical protein
MNFHLLIRRIHLYLGLSLLPWFFLYGVRSIPFSHAPYFQKLYDDGAPQWTVRFEKPYEIQVPKEGDLRATGARILADNGLEGSFGTYRPNDKVLETYLFTFWTATRVRYFVEDKRLLVEDQRSRWDQILTGMHARGGFEQDSILSDAWGIFIDVVCFGMMLWIASGVYMWWKIRSTRAWGWLALGGGVAAFAIFLAAL